MTNRTYRVTEVVGTSPQGVDDASVKDRFGNHLDRR